MRILILNQDWFADTYRARGHEVMTCGLGKHLDIVLPNPLIHIDNVISEYMDGARPDAILILDNSAPIVVDGLADTEIPILFYSVDIHHHAELHEYLGHVVDYMYVAQSDYLADLANKISCPIEWLPLWASRHVEASNHKEHGAVFVGTLDKDLNPDRVEFFEQLQKEVPLLCTTALYWEIFPHSEIVINQTVKGDLNFRVFEAMMCGAMLLTEHSKNGLLDLFEDGKHLVTYRKGDTRDAAEKIRYYLDHKEEAQKIAQAGREHILREHTSEQRALKVLETLQTLKRTRSPLRHFSWMTNFTALSNRLQKIDSNLAKRALLHALKSAELAMQVGESLDERTAFQFVFACCQYDIWLNADSGEELLKQASQRYPSLNLLKLARIRYLLNRGMQEEAADVVRELGDLPEVEVFAAAEKVVAELLHDGNNPISSVS